MQILEKDWWLGGRLTFGVGIGDGAIELIFCTTYTETGLRFPDAQTSGL